jgi:hypothetical protein
MDDSGSRIDFVCTNKYFGRVLILEGLIVKLNQQLTLLIGLIH